MPKWEGVGTLHCLSIWWQLGSKLCHWNWSSLLFSLWAVLSTSEENYYTRRLEDIVKAIATLHHVTGTVELVEWVKRWAENSIPVAYSNVTQILPLFHPLVTISFHLLSLCPTDWHSTATGHSIKVKGKESLPSLWFSAVCKFLAFTEILFRYILLWVM